MSDLLLEVLPDFDARPFSHLLPSLDKCHIKTTDLLTLDAADVAKRAQLPAGEVRKLTDAIASALHRQLGFGEENVAGSTFLSSSDDSPALKEEGLFISTLDDKLDDALCGGIPPGYVVEITGESGAGKTQVLLTLLLASQLQPPRGLGKTAIYISTEAYLATTRLVQLRSKHPAIVVLPDDEKPSLSRILCMQTSDLESQEHILRYQLPVVIQQHNVGLVILDSVAANYRAEFQVKGPNGAAASMAKRGTELVQLGALLRELARTEGIAVVVANQVADRFNQPPSGASSNAVSRTTSATSQSNVRTTSGNSQGSGYDHTHQPSNPASQLDDGLLLSPDPLALDHQQRWFTGWGDMQHEPPHTQKTPSLGLVWTNQLACRIALLKLPVFANRPLIHNVNDRDQWSEEETHISKWRRWFKVVFATWAPPSEGRGTEFEIAASGIRHVSEERSKK